MKVKITRPIRVNALAGEVEVSEQEYNRLVVLNAIEVVEVRETPEIEKKTTRRAKK